MRVLGVKMTPHTIDVQVADNRWVKTAGMVQLEVFVCDLKGVIPFSDFDGFGSPKYDAVLGCYVLEVPGILVNVHRGRILGPAEYFLAPESVQAARGSQEAALSSDLTAVSPESVQKSCAGHESARWSASWPQLPVKTFISGLHKQYSGAGTPRNQQLMTLSMLQDGSEMDLSGWDYTRDPIPLEDHNVGDVNTSDSVEATCALIAQYAGLFHTEGHRMGGAKVAPLKIKLTPGTKPQFRNQCRRSPKKFEDIQRQFTDMLNKGVILKSRSS